MGDQAHMKKSNIIAFPNLKKAIPAEEITFKSFAMALMDNDMAKAALQLERLLGVDAQSAEISAKFFHDKMKSDPGHLIQTMQLKNHIETNSQTDALVNIMNCFGLQGPLAIVALETIKKSIPGVQ